MNTIQVLDVRVIEPRLKHPTIFETFDGLEPGESFVILNDHDPKPLFYQFLAERPDQFNWEYLEQGPEEWQVRIGKNAAGEKTVGEIAASDHRKALVFKKLGIDFCCGGKKSLDEAIKEKGLSKEEVEAELEKASATDVGDFDVFNKLEADELIRHIESTHHQFIREISPQINEILNKVVRVHGDSHPELIDIRNYWVELSDELTSHMFKEEQVLFPYIKELAIANRNNGAIAPPHFGSVKNPVAVMEEEHEAASSFLTKIRELTNDYTPPEYACNSFRMTFGLLKDFEEDLINHVHLENNILFPKALEMEKRFFP
ncbi:iron-sulfur cluster repair di-iron protein [Cytophagaceae bacterium ABcell3]|nr:iron-sulfur cluster repair di-iron protein [Cytophagaceae bacterium ABcell3]